MTANTTLAWHRAAKTRENANCLYEFVHKRCSKCPLFARTHAWRCFLHWSIAVSIISPRMSPCKWFQVSQGNAATYLRCDGQTNMDFVGNLSLFAANQLQIDKVIAMDWLAQFFLTHSVDGVHTLPLSFQRVAQKAK